MSLEIPSEEELLMMAAEFDDFALDFCEKHRLMPLAMSGVFLARMTRMAQQFGYPDNYTKLLTEIVMMNEISQATFSNNSTALH